MGEYIRRAAAIETAIDYRIDVIENEYDRGYQIAVQDIAKGLNAIPAADVREVVYCKDCRHAPSGKSDGNAGGFDLEWPDGDDYQCPFRCSDAWYSVMPDPDFFCANGERKEETE